MGEHGIHGCPSLLDPILCCRHPKSIGKIGPSRRFADRWPKVAVEGCDMWAADGGGLDGGIQC
jgi:hypothetical protein